MIIQVVNIKIGTYLNSIVYSSRLRRIGAPRRVPAVSGSGGGNEGYRSAKSRLAHRASS